MIERAKKGAFLDSSLSAIREAKTYVSLADLGESGYNLSFDVEGLTTIEVSRLNLNNKNLQGEVEVKKNASGKGYIFKALIHNGEYRICNEKITKENIEKTSGTCNDTIKGYMISESAMGYTFNKPFLKADAPIKRDQIETLEIVNHINIPNDALGSYDVSAAQNGSAMLWYKQGTGNLYKVYIGGEGKVYAPANSYALFANLINLTSLNIQNLDTSKVTNMCGMFENVKLSSLEFGSSFITDKVTDMSYMFNGMVNLTTIKTSAGVNVINFNTSNVTNMRAMFDNARLSSIEFSSSFVTNNVTDMSFMFNKMENLTTIKHSGGRDNVLNFNTSNVTNMKAMFQSDAGLSNLEFGSQFVTSNVGDMGWMFFRLTALNSLNIKYFDFNKVTEFASMLYNVPTTLSITANSDGKAWLNTNFPTYTNVVLD